MNREASAVPPTRCPACDHLLTNATDVRDTSVRPKPGDVSVCINCGAALIFTKEMRQRAATRADIDDLDPEVALELGKTTAAILELQRRRRQS